MSILRPKHPLLRAIFAIGSAVWYLFKWRQSKKQPKGTVVDATGTVVDDVKRT